MKKNIRIRGHYGLTLVELMLALALSLMILGGAISVFMGSKESFRMEEEVSVLQENYRFIADRLTKELSLVGYSGCAFSYQDNTPNIFSTITDSPVQVIQGIEGGADPDSLTITFALPETGIPVLDIQTAVCETCDIPVSKELPLFIALADNFTSGSPVPVRLLVSNCREADYFLVTGTHEEDFDLDGDGSPDITGGMIEHDVGPEVGGIENLVPLTEVYGRATEEAALVYEMMTVTYEIDDVAVGGSRGLYEQRNGGARQLIFENVTDFQVLYGIDSATSEDGNADMYVDWDNALRPSDITSLRINLTMLLGQQAGTDITREYSFTVKLRNMGLDT
ncbi:MAG: PilW family protein [Candidatus Thiodiazotropha sp. (ex Monitilora ramsayi)]|nr:PilW family protein [Candidatus Thiodiazotropha sp. (ex Monitilora ramsayi)]